MMEQTDTGECHYHIVLITALNHEIIADRSSRLSNISNTTFMCTFNIICKREGRIEGEAGLILKMYKNGLSAEQIASATDKQLEEVKEIIAGI